jgi:phosphohistidine phosphatase
MDLLLWRHAHAHDALPGQSDMDRPLSRKGEKQATAVAKWLNEKLPENTQILCSPAMRTLQTVAFLNRVYQVCEDIAPDADASALLNAVDWPRSKHAVLVVAHQPFLAETVARLLNLNPARPLSFRKGGLWWIRQHIKDSSSDVELVCVLNPELVI